jgi:hypothetical protein
MVKQFQILKQKKGQAVIVGLFRSFILVVLGIFLLQIYPPFKDLAFAATESLWIRIPVLMLPIFYFIGIIFSFVNTIRGGASA